MAGEDLEGDLRRETTKWLERIKKETKGMTIDSEKGRGFKKNMDAYIKDSEFFLENGDLIRAFEAVVWAWSIYEICKEMDIF